jgi:hypothetical protein
MYLVAELEVQVQDWVPIALGLGGWQWQGHIME